MTTQDNNNILMPYFNIYGADFLAFQNKISKDDWWDICIALSDECIFGATNFIAKNDFQKMLYDKIKLQKNKSYIAYKSKIENGKLGGRPKKNENRNETETKPIGYQSVNRNETETKPKEDNRIENKIIEDNNDYKKNNIKKENVFVEQANEDCLAIDIVDNTPKSTDPQIHILTENDNQKPVNYNKKIPDPTLSILTDQHAEKNCQNKHFLIEKNNENIDNAKDICMNTTLEKQLITKNEVVIERNKQYQPNDLITDEMMVLDCFVQAGISVFGDGQFGFGSQLVKDVSLEELYDKTAIMQWGKTKILKKIDTCTICKENNATYQQLYNVIYQTFQKEYKPLAYINSYLSKELNKINQLTYGKNDNTLQRSTNVGGDNQQEQSGSTKRYITAGTTTNYGTGAEALQRYLNDNVKGYKR